MVTTFKGLANKWIVLALLLASLGAVLAITLLPLGAQTGPIEFPENSEEAVADFTAVDPEGTSSATTWAVVTDATLSDDIDADDVADSALFAISKDGVLTFNDAPDFEAPAGGTADDSNTYSLVISAKVGSETSYEVVTVEVTNVDEPADTGIELSLVQPREGSRIRVLFTDKVGNPFLGADGASLSPAINADYPTGAAASGIVDPDRGKDDADTTAIPAEDVNWQWSRGSSRTGTFTDIEDATGPVYTVVDDDRTRYLRVTATYEDREGEGKTLMATSIYPTLLLRRDNVAPKFADNVPATPDPIDLPQAEIADGSGEGTVVGSYAAARETAHGERLTYFLEGATTAAQADFFQIDRATGQVTVGLGKTIQDEADTHANVEGEVEPSGGFIVRIRAVDGYEDIQANPITQNFGTGDLTITVDGEDENPVFSAGKTSHEFDENAAVDTAFYDFNAHDPETSGSGEATFALSGPDMGDFTLAADGGLTFNAIPNFESPADANKDNIYEITVKASAASTIGGDAQPEKSTSINVMVTVKNVDEPGEVALSARNPRIGVPISARVVSDTDGAVSGITWRWERDDQGSAGSPSTCSAITADQWEAAKGDGANMATYTPQLADDGKCLRAVASYTDPAGTGGTANEVSDVAVVKARNLAPMFEEGMETRYVQENTLVTGVVVEDDDGTTASTATPNADLVTADDSNDAEPDATDGPIDYNLSGPDAMYFTIDSTGDPDLTDSAGGTVAPVAGQIRVSSAGSGKLDYETRRTYRVTVTATDRSGLSNSISVVINITDLDEGPEIMQGRLAVSGPPLIAYTSMSTDDVATYTVVGVDANGTTWDLSGDDAGDFSISADGVLTFNSPPNHASPMDANGDNAYEVTIEAESGMSMDTLDVTVTVGMMVAAEARTDISQYTNQERFDLDGNGIVDDSEVRQVLRIWAQDNPGN